MSSPTGSMQKAGYVIKREIVIISVAARGVRHPIGLLPLHAHRINVAVAERMDGIIAVIINFKLVLIKTTR